MTTYHLGINETVLQAGVLPCECSSHGILDAKSQVMHCLSGIPADAAIDGRAQCDVDSFYNTVPVRLNGENRTLRGAPITDFANSGSRSGGRESNPACGLSPGYACQ